MKINLENMKAFLLKYKVYVIISVIFVVMVLTLVKVSSGGSKEVAKEASSEEVINTVGETTPETAEVKKAPSDELQVDAYPAVNELVTKYYTAMSNGDIDTLLQIVNPLSEEKKAQIQQKQQYIEGYNNITCYTKIGPEENSYIVFVYYEIKFININTLVPGEIPLYICANEDGSLYINEGELTPEIDSYISNIATGQDVVDLISKVETKFAEAQAADPDLKAFIEKLSGTTEVAETPEEVATPEEAATLEEAVTPEQPVAEQPVAEATTDGIQEVDETIYAVETVNVRDASSEDGSRLGQLYVGESAKRTGIISNGWSRIEFNGKTGYVLTECLTTQGATQEIKYLTSTVNIREEADENSNRVGTAYLGAKVTRTAQLDNGWSKINSDGVIGYVKSEFLADTYN